MPDFIKIQISLFKESKARNFKEYKEHTTKLTRSFFINVTAKPEVGIPRSIIYTHLSIFFTVITQKQSRIQSKKKPNKNKQIELS